jgi:hypothetical protein
MLAWYKSDVDELSLLTVTKMLEKHKYIRKQGELKKTRGSAHILINENFRRQSRAVPLQGYKHKLLCP